MDKNGNITISYDTWKDGIKTPLTGMADIVNIDIFDEPGVAKIDFAPTEVIGEGDVTDGDTRAFTCCAIDTEGDAYIGSDEGDSFVLDESTDNVTETNHGTAGNFQNNVFWKGWTIYASYDSTFRRINLSAYDGNTFQPNFVNTTTNSLRAGDGDFRFSRTAMIKYFDWVFVASGRYVAYLEETVGQDFDATDSNTYTWTAEALDLPEDIYIDGFFIYNGFLMISAGNLDTPHQRIYPWRLASATGESFPETFNIPIELNNGVAAQLQTDDNLFYFMNGNNGVFSVSNISNIEDFSKFDNLVFPNADSGIAQKSEAITKVKDCFLVGVSNEEAGVSPIGVYVVRDGAYTRQTLSEELDGSADNIRIHFIEPYQYSRYLVGWENVTDDTYGVDLFGKSDYRYTGYKAAMESPLYQPGLVLNDKSYQQVEIVLAKELATGQGIKISYRENLTDSWTELGTYDYATYGAVSKINAQDGIMNTTTLQIKVELTTGASSTTTPELISVRLF